MQCADQVGNVRYTQFTLIKFVAGGKLLLLTHGCKYMAAIVSNLCSVHYIIVPSSCMCITLFMHFLEKHSAWRQNQE